MTTQLSNRGQVLIPQAVRRKRALEAGDDLAVFLTSTGDVLLRPLKAPRRSLLSHLDGLRGLRLKRNKEPLPPAIEL
jgi:AbrB family looped-hinge helix DNA binding protein